MSNTTNTIGEIPIRIDNATSILEAQRIYQEAIAEWQLWYRKQLIMFGAGQKKEVNEVMSLMNEIVDGMALCYGVSLAELKSQRRHEDIVLMRTCVFYTLIDKYKFSRVAVGKCFGKNHATIIHGLDKVEDWLKQPYRFEREIKALKVIYPEVKLK